MVFAGIAMMVIGGILLLQTRTHARSETEAEASHDRERTARLASRILSPRDADVEWLYRQTFRHPVLTRLPPAIAVTAGLVMVFVGLSRS